MSSKTERSIAATDLIKREHRHTRAVQKPKCANPLLPKPVFISLLPCQCGLLHGLHIPRECRLHSLCYNIPSTKSRGQSYRTDIALS